MCSDISNSCSLETCSHWGSLKRNLYLPFKPYLIRLASWGILRYKTLPLMNINDNHQNEPIDKKNQIDEPAELGFKPKTNEELNAENPARQNRRQATEKQLNNPLHGVKLAQILERLVEYYGWEYLAERVKIRCFMYYPTMKSSLGFLRKTSWAREHVEDVYLDMLEEKEKK